MLYFDTSFLVPLFLKEPTSGKIQQYLRRKHALELATSHWTRLEFSSLLAREVRILSLDRDPPKRRAAPPMEPFLGQVHQLAPRRAQQGRAIVREEIRRLEVRLGQRP